MATLNQKVNLLKGLANGEIARTGPLFVDLDMTNRCNLRCFGCSYHSPLGNAALPGDPEVSDMPFSLFQRICSELKAMNVYSMVLQGAGEPLLHPRIFDMISYAKAAGFHLVLITNGTLLNRDAIRSLVDARLDVLKVSFWASSAEQYRQSHPDSDPDNFRKVVEGLKLLTSTKSERQSGLPVVYIHHPITRFTFQAVDAVVDLACKTGCDGVSWSVFRPDQSMRSSLTLSDGQKTVLRNSLLQAKIRLKLFSIKHNTNQVLMRYRIGASVWEKLPCYIAWYHARFRVDGTVHPCGMYRQYLGNLYQKTFREIWNDFPYRAFRKQTITRQGLAACTAEQYNCTYCCFIADNVKVHRLFRWLSPFCFHHRNRMNPDLGRG